jgi:hypothetical protein
MTTLLHVSVCGVYVLINITFPSYYYVGDLWYRVQSVSGLVVTWSDDI